MACDSPAKLMVYQIYFIDSIDDSIKPGPLSLTHVTLERLLVGRSKFYAKKFYIKKKIIFLSFKFEKSWIFFY